MVAPVAQSIPPERSGSVESVTSLLTEGLVRRGNDVTLFATKSSQTTARLHATFDRGYAEDPALWPWELCELFNLAAAVERAASFDIIHYQAEYYPMSLAFTRLSPVPIVQTLHHAPGPTEIALWAHYPQAPFVAVSRAQANSMKGLAVAGIVPHAIDVDGFPFRSTPDDYLLFLGRFTEGKGVLEAIEIARRVGMKLVLAAAENDYFDAVIRPRVDGARVVYAGEVDHRRRCELLGGARALLYPVREGEPFGLVMAEAMACGTPVAALNRGAVPEIVEQGVTGAFFDTVDGLIAGLPQALSLDRHQIRRVAADRFSTERMVDGYMAVYEALV